MRKIAGRVFIIKKQANHLTIMKHHENDSEPGTESGPTKRKRHFDSFGEAFRGAREDATRKAKEAAPRMKSAVTEVVYELAYGGAYGGVFLGALAAELVPENIKESVARGARAGREKARTAADRAREAMKPKATAEAGEAVIDIETNPAGA